MHKRAVLYAIAFARGRARRLRPRAGTIPIRPPTAGRTSSTRSFIDRPKHLDPARSYTSDEWGFIQQIYEPPLQYHYLKRPYELIPQSARSRYRGRAARRSGTRVATGLAGVGGGVQRVRDPHPGGHPLPAAPRVRRRRRREAAVSRSRRRRDQAQVHARRLPADRHARAHRRGLHLPDQAARAPARELADLRSHGRVHRRAEGLSDTLGREQALAKGHERSSGRPTRGCRGSTCGDSHSSGVERRRSAHLSASASRASTRSSSTGWRCRSSRRCPWEADEFYAQRGMDDGRNLTLDWWPVGTGPYMLTENDPNARMVLAAQSAISAASRIPSEGEPEDREAGLLADAGKTMPFVDRIVFTREKEGIPLLEQVPAGLLRHVRHQLPTTSTRRCAVQRRRRRGPHAGDGGTKGIRLRTSVGTEHVLPRVQLSRSGRWAGCRERARKLRQAISIAVDWEEFISHLPQRPRHPGAWGRSRRGIFGFREGEEASIRSSTTGWTASRSANRIEAAKKLLAEAGYPDGRDAKTGQPLVLYLDTVPRGPGDKPRLDWYRAPVRQARRSSSRSAPPTGTGSRRRCASGNTQLFFLGWNADYPDPENFMFLLNGPQSRAKTGGENTANYQNPEYDRAVRAMKNIAERSRAAGDHRPDAEDRARGRALGLGLPPQGLRPVARWLSERQAEPDGAQQPQVSSASTRAARREARGVESARCCGRSGCCSRCSSACAMPAIIDYRRRERMAARPACAMLAYIVRRVLLRDPDPDRGQSHHLRAVLRRQHARRHGAHAARREAGHARRRSRSGRPNAATTSRCSGTASAQGMATRHRHHLLREIGAAVRVRLRQRRRRARHRARDPHAHVAEPRARDPGVPGRARWCTSRSRC